MAHSEGDRGDVKEEPLTGVVGAEDSAKDGEAPTDQPLCMAANRPEPERVEAGHWNLTCRSHA